MWGRSAVVTVVSCRASSLQRAHAAAAHLPALELWAERLALAARVGQVQESYHGQGNLRPGKGESERPK